MEEISIYRNEKTGYGFIKEMNVFFTLRDNRIVGTFTSISSDGKLQGVTCLISQKKLSQLEKMGFSI